jgi:hypothetical protein
MDGRLSRLDGTKSEKAKAGGWDRSPETSVKKRRASGLATIAAKTEMPAQAYFGINLALLSQSAPPRLCQLVLRLTPRLPQLASVAARFSAPIKK